MDHHDVPREPVVSVLRLLDKQSDRVQAALDRGRAPSAVWKPWAESQAALSLLLDRYSDGGGAPERARRREPGREPEPAPRPARPETIKAEIQEAEWVGTITPDLVVRGVLEGLGIESAELVVMGEDDRVRFRNRETFDRAIQTQLEGKDRNEWQRVTWQLRIDDDDLGSGMNRIVVTLRDRWDKEVTAETRIRKRLF